MGTLMKWAKESNKGIYVMTINLFLQKSDVVIGALCVAKVKSNDLKKHLKFCNDMFYGFDKKSCLWYKTKQPRQIVNET